MKKRIVIFALAVGMLASFTGCQEIDDGINISIQSEKQTTQEKKETEETDKNERTEEVNINNNGSEEKTEEKKTEKNQSDSKEKQDKKNDEAKTEEKAPDKQSPYQYGEDIKDEGVSAMKNSDGTIELIFKSGKFSLTLPASLENHFIIYDGHLSSKAYYNDTDGYYSKMACIGFSEEFRTYYPWVCRLLGKSGNTYMWSGCSTDADYAPDYPEDPTVKEEFDLIESCLEEIYSSAKSYNERTGKMERIFDFPDDAAFKGEVLEDGISGITSDDFVSGKISKEKAPKWDVEKGWHITAKRAVSCPDGTYFDCYDTDDGDHYGWILDKYTSIALRETK